MIGEILKKLRQESNFTQKDVIEKAKELETEDKKAFTQSQLSKWESNETFPTVENIELLNKIFNCSLDELIHNEDKIILEELLDQKRLKLNDLEENSKEESKNDDPYYEQGIKYR